MMNPFKSTRTRNAPTRFSPSKLLGSATKKKPMALPGPTDNVTSDWTDVHDSGSNTSKQKDRKNLKRSQRRTSSRRKKLVLDTSDDSATEEEEEEEEEEEPKPKAKAFKRPAAVQSV